MSKKRAWHEQELWIYDLILQPFDFFFFLASSDIYAKNIHQSLLLSFFAPTNSRTSVALFILFFHLKLLTFTLRKVIYVIKLWMTHGDVEAWLKNGASIDKKLFECKNCINAYRSFINNELFQYKQLDINEMLLQATYAALFFNKLWSCN
jgi:hypothetical protein